jgi:glycosyltransferase involved in cell wall biosynthesis
MDKPLISFIVAIYNVEKYISNCIDSIIEQTYKNIEIVLVDDGSKDSSGTICVDYAKQDDRIKVVHTCNGGLSSARNVGIENALGEFFIFIDGDDSISPEMTEIFYESALKYNADIG